MNRLLVTGGAGFIGANFLHYWAKRYPEDRIVVLDALTYAGNLQSLADLLENPQVQFVKGDIADQELVTSLIRENKLDTIVHFAAESHVDRSITGPDTFVKTNILGTYSLLEVARAEWVAKNKEHRFHHVSTDEVFGSLDAGDPAFSETTAYSPNSPYSASKAASDHLVRSYHHTYGLQVTTTNCSNNYGPFQFPEKLIPLMVVNALQGEALPVYGDGTNIRDWLHVEDHVRAIDLVLADGRVGETYNVGGNEEHSNLDIVERLCSAVDGVLAASTRFQQRFPDSPVCKGGSARSLIEFVKDRPGHDWRYAIDSSKIKADLEFQPLFTFETGLRSTVEWLLENETWWRAVLDESYRSWISENYSQR